MPTDLPAPDAAVAQTLGLGPTGRRRRRWPWVLAAVLVLGLLLVLASQLGGDTQTAWRTGQVEQGDLVVTVTAVGTLEPLNAVDVSLDVSGTVKAVYVDTDAQVTQDQVLLELDPTLLQAQERQAAASLAAVKASLGQAQVNLRSAQKEQERAETIARSGALSEAMLDQARMTTDQAASAVEVASAQVRQAQAALDAARTQLDRAVLRSPIAGVVLERNVEPGQAVISALQASTLFRVAEDLARMRIDVDVDEADVGRVHPGQTASFTVAAWPERVFQATVHKVDLAPKKGLAVVTYVATLHVDNQDGLLRPGMTATALVEAERLQGQVLLPTAALRFTPPGVDLPPPEARAGKKVGRVWILDGDKPSPVEVVTGPSDGRRAVLVEGELSVGTPLVLGVAPREGSP